MERVSISGDQLEELNAIANQIVKEKQPFERLAVPRDVALKMFTVIISLLLFFFYPSFFFPFISFLIRF